MTEIEKNLRRNIGNKLKLARAKTKYTREFDSFEIKKSLKALQMLIFFCQISLFLLTYCLVL